MRLETYCNRQIDCVVCPQKSEEVLVYRHYPKGQHFSAEKCTQNCMIFMLKGELLVNSNEYPGTTLQSRQLILQAIGSKVELLALTEVEYIVYWFTELPLICEERYKEILKRSEAREQRRYRTFQSLLSGRNNRRLRNAQRTGKPDRISDHSKNKYQGRHHGFRIHHIRQHVIHFKNIIRKK